MKKVRNIAILGATKLANTSWRPGKKVCSFAFLGATELDFRQAELEEGVTKVKAIALLGANSIIVPKDIPVSLSGFSFLGARESKFSEAKQPVASSNKSLQVTGISILGACVVSDVSEEERKCCR
jgi:hypothetical protein